MLYLFDTTLRSTVSICDLHQCCIVGRPVLAAGVGVYDTFGKQSGFAHPQMYELFDLEKDPYEV